MKDLKVDFSELVRLGRIMMPEGSEFTIGRHFDSFEPIDSELKAGKEIHLADLDNTPALLSVRGRQVVLYIKDHTNKFDLAIENGERGNRFHIAQCKTLDEMRQSKRFQRYVATNRLDGLFPIEEASFRKGLPRTGEARLKVCKYCLERLNYKGSSNYEARQKAFKSFSFTEFFSCYSTCFKYMPSTLDEKSSVGYTEDWPELSKKVRMAAGYICDQCGVDLSSQRNLCDVHHVNGVKSDNRLENLRVLCKDCHRKQPMHTGIFISAADMAKILRLRLQQSRLNISDWKDAFKLSDTAIHGDMHVLRARGYPPPIIGYDLQKDSGEVFITLEAAWPDRRIAINLMRADVPGWKVFGVGELAACRN